MHAVCAIATLPGSRWWWPYAIPAHSRVSETDAASSCTSNVSLICSTPWASLIGREQDRRRECCIHARSSLTVAISVEKCSLCRCNSCVEQ